MTRGDYNAYRRAWRKRLRFEPGRLPCRCGSTRKEIRGPFKAGPGEALRDHGGLVWWLWCPKCGRYGRRATAAEVDALYADIPADFQGS